MNNIIAGGDVNVTNKVILAAPCTVGIFGFLGPVGTFIIVLVIIIEGIIITFVIIQHNNKSKKTENQKV